jgi:hypothetical protein
MSLKSELFYPHLPQYYVDFNKFFGGKLTQDIPLERYELDNTSDLYKFITDYLKNCPYPKISFPVFFFNRQTGTSTGRMEIFGLLRYIKNEVAASVGVELVIYPLNMVEFNEIWEESQKISQLMKIRPEVGTELNHKLSIYYEKTPIYYSYYFSCYDPSRRLTELFT